MRDYFIILILSWVCILAFFFMMEYAPKKQNVEFIQGGDIQKAQTIDSLNRIIDSLHFNVQPCESELKRYQLAFQIFIKRNPTAAEQFSNIIAEETE